MASSYTAKDILVLEGLEPVRRRPGMYIGGVDAAGLHHLIWELVDNSVDEAMHGHADRITVTLRKDGASATVADNGRGIPVDRHAQYKKPALELILTTLHAGGKFEAKNYYHSGGLHGVGASVVTALSEKLVARVRRDGAEWERTFARGKPASALKRVGPARGSGTSIFFLHDPKIFPDVRFDLKRIAELLEAKAYLHGGVAVEFHDEHAGTKAVYRYEDGLRAYLDKLVGEAGRSPLAGEVFTIQKEQDGLHLDCALAWTEATEERVLSYVNSIPTISGGAHENGLRAGLAKAVRNYLTVHNLVPRGITIAAEDVREGLVAVLAIKIPQPPFQAQTKQRLNNAAVTPLIDGIRRSSVGNALSCGTGKDFGPAKLRYHKICLLMDADSDGNHICTLLLTFFYRHLPELIRQGYVYIAQPPLYRIDAGKEVLWARDDAEKERLLAARNGSRGTLQVQRFKGLGEMNPSTLKETTLDPERRALLRVAIRDAARTEQTIQTLMGREVAPRFELIMERAPKVDELDV